MSTTEIINIEAPVFPESVTDATVTAIHVTVGQAVKIDEKLIDLETDKVVFEVVATAPGVITEIVVKEDDVVVQGDLLVKIDKNAGASQEKPAQEKVASTAKAAEPASVAKEEKKKTSETPEGFASPSARRSGTLSQVDKKPEPQVVVQHSSNVVQQSLIERVPMTRLRAKIAERLLDSQHQTATLTTFNEVNLQAVIDLRTRYREKFEKEHGIKLGFMSFFTKAVVAGLKQFPAINAFIEGNDLIYHHYYDIGVAVSTDRGLVVPVLRNVDQMSLSDIEKAIHAYGTKARNGTITMAELSGGTFTISNGGIFGSLLGTPILNPPQSGILGMHKIEQRAVVENGEIVIRPMMYLALSYDHRIVDGKESVQFLATVKNLLEDPTRFLLDI